MKTLHLTELPISGLHNIFVPPGLPLVAKGPEAVPTTSILVRGGPGVGKTTLALALGQPIARANQGVVLYLSSEIGPTELVFKARVLGLSESLVVPWDDRAVAEEGGLIAHHLLLTRSGEDAKTVAEQRRSLLGAANEMLAEYQAASPKVPVRAVIIDAFGLQTSESDEAFRGEALALIQFLESAGISTLLVEEVGQAPDESLAFLTDLSFQLTFDEDRDTGEYTRKLTCGKSRYVNALRGPHDYGLESGRPALWPDLLSVVGASEEAMETFGVPEQRRAHLLLDAEQLDHYHRLSGGMIALSSEVLDLALRTPGVRLAVVRCGSFIRVTNRDGTTMCQALASEGPHCLGWMIVGLLRDAQINTAVLLDLDLLLDRERHRTSIRHVLEAFRMLGILVIIHDTPNRLKSIRSLADYRSKEVYRNNTFKTFASRLHRPAILLLPMPDSAAIVARFGLSQLEASAWMHALLDQHVLLPLLDAIQEPRPARATWVLFYGMCAIYTPNDEALKFLQEARGEEEKLAVPLLLRALCQRGRWEEAVNHIDDFATRHTVPDYLLRRIKAELPLEGAPDKARLQQAQSALQDLANETGLPDHQHEDIVHNLTVVEKALAELAELDHLATPPTTR